MEQINYLFETLSDQFTGLKKIDVKCEFDKRCTKCHGRKKIIKRSVEFDEMELADELAMPLNHKPEFIDCPDCNATGTIEMEIKIVGTVEKKPKAK